MKKFKILFLVLSLGISNFLPAGELENRPETSTTLSAEISKFMKRHYFPLEEDLVVEVKFRINEYREIVVLSVISDNPEVRGFIASSLNNKIPDSKSFQTGKLYSMPVRLTP